MKMVTKLPMTNPLIEQKVKELENNSEVINSSLWYINPRDLPVVFLSLYNQGQMDALGKVEEYIKEHQEYPGGTANGAWIYNGGLLSHIASLKEQIK